MVSPLQSRLPCACLHAPLALPCSVSHLSSWREGAYTVLRGGRKLFGVELALLALLHTWGQLLLAHVHSHCLLPLGGLRRNYTILPDG